MVPQSTPTTPQTAGRPTTNAPSDEDPHLADLDDVYLDGTLVLVGCGKAKRDPDDPTDLHLASVPPGDPITRHGRETGPAWRAADLYTSSYFAAKRAFAETVSNWTRSRDDGAAGWAILSAEHHILRPWQDVAPYDTTIEDLGDNPTEAADRFEGTLPGPQRCPDGREVVTKLDAWAARVALGLGAWLASYRTRPDGPGARPQWDATTLLVLAGQDYVEPLCERGVFEYGLQRMLGNPNEGWPGDFSNAITTRFLFEELDAGGIGEQLAWLSDAVSRLTAHQPDDVLAATEQADLGSWGTDRRTCSVCGIPASQADSLDDYDDAVYCTAHFPIGECARCETPTHQTGHGTYPLCGECQTENGGMTDEPLPEDTADGEQAALEEVIDR